MTPFRDAPIKRKLMLVILMTTGLALILMAGAVVGYELLTFRQAITRSTEALAKVIASISSSTVAFQDDVDATEVLSVLTAEPRITAAAIYNIHGRVFSRFPKNAPDELIPAQPGADGTSMNLSRLIAFEPIMQKDGRLGTIYLQADLREMYWRLLTYGGLVAFAGLFAIAGAVAVSTVLQRRISLPIVELAQIARGVSQRQDYSVRASRHGRDEIGDLTDAFNEMLRRTEEARGIAAKTQEDLQVAKEIAEAANNAKDEFLAILSHELRTPLTPVLATLAMLEEEPATTPRMLRDLEMIRRNVEVEARLIDDLLDVTRIARGKLELHLHTVDFRTLLSHAVGNYLNPQAAEKKLKVSMDVDAAVNTWIHADSSRITQVLWNLLQNACKFTPEGGAISIHVTNEMPEPPRDSGLPDLSIVITDNGIGIDEEFLARIFNAFEQGERSRTRLFGGLGLGLAVCKTIVEMHGGALTATSPGRDRGATFTLRLPTVKTPIHAADVPGAADSPTKPKAATAAHLLLVEDHHDTANQFARLLTRSGHVVSCAHSLEEARNLAAVQHFDLVISDLGLPDGSGQDLMRELSQRYHIPGIALSGYGMEEDVRDSLAAGFSRHLTKPVNWTELKATIQTLLSAHTEQK